MKKQIRLAIVDDSPFVRKALQRILSDVPEILVVGSATSGEELLNNLHDWSPDVITLDLSMPGMGGLLTLDRIMEKRPVPVIILSTHSSKDAPLTIEALHRGAVDFIDKQQYSLVDFKSLRKVLVEKIFQVTRAIALQPEHPPSIKKPDKVKIKKTPHVPSADDALVFFDVIVIGASTGGPPAIQQILEDIGSDLPVPIAIVQHMPIGFTGPFAKRLKAHVPFNVQEASDTEIFQPGTVYIGPTGSHLRLKRENGNVYTVLTRYPENLPHRPSVDILFQTAAQVYGKRVLAILLTGMGNDGAYGMAELSKTGAYTIAQNEASCVVFGMPRVAHELGAVKELLHINSIGKKIAELLNHKEV
jgi:two-component system chemotaxis response regulator CheB